MFLATNLSTSYYQKSCHINATKRKDQTGTVSLNEPTAPLASNEENLN